MLYKSYQCQQHLKIPNKVKETNPRNLHGYNSLLIIYLKLTNMIPINGN